MTPVNPTTTVLQSAQNISKDLQDDCGNRLTPVNLTTTVLQSAQNISKDLQDDCGNRLTPVNLTTTVPQPVQNVRTDLQDDCGNRSTPVNPESNIDSIEETLSESFRTPLRSPVQPPAAPVINPMQAVPPANNQFNIDQELYQQHAVQYQRQISNQNFDQASLSSSQIASCFSQESDYFVANQDVIPDQLKQQCKQFDDSARQQELLRKQQVQQMQQQQLQSQQIQAQQRYFQEQAAQYQASLQQAAYGMYCIPVSSNSYENLARGSSTPQQNNLPYNQSPQTASVASYPDNSVVNGLKQQIAILESQLTGARNEIALNSKELSKKSSEIDALIRKQENETAIIQSEAKHTEAHLRFTLKSTLESNESQREVIAEQNKQLQRFARIKEELELKHKKAQEEFENRISLNDEKIQELFRASKQAAEDQKKGLDEQTQQVSQFCQDIKKQQTKTNEKLLNKLNEESRIREAQTQEISRQLNSRKTSRRSSDKDGRKQTHHSKKKATRRIRSEDRLVDITSSSDHSSWIPSSESEYSRRDYRERRE